MVAPTIVNNLGSAGVNGAGAREGAGAIQDGGYGKSGIVGSGVRVAGAWEDEAAGMLKKGERG